MRESHVSSSMIRYTAENGETAPVLGLFFASPWVLWIRRPLDRKMQFEELLPDRIGGLAEKRVTGEARTHAVA